MSNTKELFDIREPAPIVVGAGLVALDVIIDNHADNQGDLVHLATGGSCANVLSILTYLGWRSFPIARLGKDMPSTYILDDLRKFGVQLEFLDCETNGQTPVVIEVINGMQRRTRTHFFSFTCPHCGAPLPRYKPLLKKSVPQITDHLSKPSVFYFDRISHAAIDLARTYAQRGALVVFEPSALGKKELFKECIEIAHVVKYSHERLHDGINSLEHAKPILEVQTMGAEGLRFRVSRGLIFSDWKYLGAYPVTELIDEAGSGDWCTAGLIHVLGQAGKESLANAEDHTILKALDFGQALAAFKCGFAGARGGMYSLDRQEFRVRVEAMMEGNCLEIREQKMLPKAVEKLLNSICTNCRKISGSDLALANKGVNALKNSQVH